MPAYTINLNPELIEKLSKEENKSGTVQKALNIYYEVSEDPKEKLKLLLNQITRLQAEVQIIEKQIDQLEETREKHKTITEEIQKEELEEKQKRNKEKADVLERGLFFNNYIFPEEINKEELFERFKRSGERMIIYMKKMGIERRERKSQFD
jgi:septal ring factor EnvC (AmiA/AmiB activator)